MKVCVVNFWNGAFDGDFYEFLFKAAWGDFHYTADPHEADAVITSVFGNVQTEPRKTICYIGENVRPNFLGYSHSLSFDWDTYGGRNFRLPLWYSRIAWPGFTQKPREPNAYNHGFEDPIPLNRLLYARRYDPAVKREFCVMVAGNPEGLRVNLFNTIAQYKPIHGYGNMFGNPLRQSKFDTLPQYKFCLCPENSVYDGYVTEKLIDAYAGDTLPIYSGTDSVTRDFNGSAFLNYMEMKDMTRFVDQIKSFDEQDERYQDMYEQPLLTEEPSLHGVLAFLRSVGARMTD